MKYLIIISILSLTSNAFSEDISLCKEGWNVSTIGKNIEAIELYRKCIAEGKLSDASLARTYRNIGISLQNSGQYEEAIKSYDKALSLKPSDPRHDFVNRGNAWSELGEYKNALADYDRALEVSPSYNEVYYNRGVLYEKQENYPKAIEEFKRAYELGLRTQLLYERLVAHKLIEE